MIIRSAPPRRPEETSMPIVTLLAGGPLHGRQIRAQSPPLIDVEGQEYRHATGPYHPGGRDPYQIYVFAELDEFGAADALRALLASGAVDAAAGGIVEEPDPGAENLTR